MKPSHNLWLVLIWTHGAGLRQAENPSFPWTMAFPLLSPLFARTCQDPSLEPPPEQAALSSNIF